MPVLPREEGSVFREARGRSWIVLQMFTSSRSSLFRSPFYLHSRAEFYTHFICTHGTQIHYKCELSSKLFKDHLYCSLWSHLLSLALNHTVFMPHIVLRFKLFTWEIGYIYYIPIICASNAHMQCVSVCLYACVCVQCVHSANEKGKRAAAQ